MKKIIMNTVKKNIMKQIWLIKTKLSVIEMDKRLKKIKFDRDKRFEQDCIEYYSTLGIKVKKTKELSMYYYYSKNRDVRYIPYYLYTKKIIPKLNKTYLNACHIYKGFYNLLMPDHFLIPNLIVFCNGFFSYRENEEQIIKIVTKQGVIFKPSLDSGGGKGISCAFSVEEYKHYLDIYQKQYDDFVVQEIVAQHDFTSQFNKTSLNTIRCMVYRSPKTQKAIVLNSVFRVGKEGSRVDNFNKGGRLIGIDNGVLNKFSSDKYGNRSKFVNGINLSEGGFFVPYWEEILNIAKCSIKNFQHGLIFGLDMCILADNSVRVVEVNYSTAIDIFQMTNGPVFGEYTEEILKLINNRKTYYSIRGYFD